MTAFTCACHDGCWVVPGLGHFRGSAQTINGFLERIRWRHIRSVNRA